MARRIVPAGQRLPLSHNDHFVWIATRSRFSNGSTLTLVTLSEKPTVVLGYHSGAVGMSLPSSASACWYSPLASSLDFAAAAWASSFSNAGLLYSE